jgi:hypothetical protein
MTERVLDSRSALPILRRCAASLAHTAMTGALGVMALVHELRPPQYSSTNHSHLPSAPPADSDKPSSREQGTKERIALSDEALGPAGKAVMPVLTTGDVPDRVTTTAPTSDTETGLGGPSTYCLDPAVAPAMLRIPQTASR